MDNRSGLCGNIFSLFRSPQFHFTKKHKNFFEKHSITFFEATTAMAFDYFKKNNVDIAIVENGLGGRLDSTNVLSPIHTIITEIDFDHTHLLAETV